MKRDLRWDKIQAKEVYYSFLDHAIAHLVRLNLLDAIGEMSTVVNVHDNFLTEIAAGCHTTRAPSWPSAHVLKKETEKNNLTAGKVKQCKADDWLSLDNAT